MTGIIFLNDLTTAQRVCLNATLAACVDGSDFSFI
jgi:hypothetical protein